MTLSSEQVQLRRMIAGELRAARTKLGWTQKQLAEKAGRTYVLVSRIECCKANVELQSLVDLFSAMGIRFAFTLEKVR